MNLSTRTPLMLLVWASVPAALPGAEARLVPSIVRPHVRSSFSVEVLAADRHGWLRPRRMHVVDRRPRVVVDGPRPLAVRLRNHAGFDIAARLHIGGRPLSRLVVGERRPTPPFGRDRGFRFRSPAVANFGAERDEPSTMLLVPRRGELLLELPADFARGTVTALLGVAWHPSEERPGADPVTPAESRTLLDTSRGTLTPVERLVGTSTVGSLSVDVVAEPDAPVVRPSSTAAAGTSTLDEAVESFVGRFSRALRRARVSSVRIAPLGTPYPGAWHLRNALERAITADRLEVVTSEADVVITFACQPREEGGGAYDFRAEVVDAEGARMGTVAVPVVVDEAEDRALLEGLTFDATTRADGSLRFATREEVAASINEANPVVMALCPPGIRRPRFR